MSTEWTQQAGMAGDVDTDNVQDFAESAQTAATNAATSETNAASSASSAATSASNASTSATNAATSATQAASSASNAASSETAAATSASNASTSASESAASATDSQNSATASASSAANALTSENNAEASETAAAGSASSAATSATNASNSATAASTSATNAANSATAASTSETNAATSETNAANSATAAATSASSASSSATSAAGSATDANTYKLAAQAAQAAAEAAQSQTEDIFDQFGDQYLGSKTSDPTVDNDGDPLTIGDIYWNSTSNTLRFYTGSAWVAPETVATTAATAAQTAQTAAETAQTAAETAQTAAETAETNAETAETNAASSEFSASTSATNAANSATSASTSATNAAASETAAEASETAAASSASSASTSATNASNSATSASTSATNASNSATAALASENAAASSETAAAANASAASTSETNAATSETNAATSETNAATSASQAATSATNSANSASAASASASAAATSETNASASETAAANSVTGAATSASNAASSATAAGTSETNAASSASAASTSETNAANSATNAATSASAASTSEINAATSESNAANSATAASGSASSASTSASNAATSATAAAGSATSAASAQTAAESARDSAEAAYDNFDDRYLGAKTSDPGLDNDGNALITGALYFNTTDDLMKVYDGATWLAAFASLGGALIASNNLSDLANASTARTNLGLGTAATTDSTAYATAAQGSLADSATQPGDNVSTLTNDSGYLTGNQTITLSGDASGSGTTSIIVTVADDSHNHVISNIDSLQTTLDSKLPTAGGTMTGFITLHADPTNALHAATKEYVDTIASASLHYHDPVRVESPIALTATYSNGTSGVGATLTNSGTQAVLAIDGVTLSLNDRVLIYQQVNAFENGVYYVSNVGSGSTNWVLTRSTDTDSYGASDPAALGLGDAFYVLEGNTGAGQLYVMNTEGAITIGTTGITFAEISSAQIYVGGSGIDISGTTISHADTSSQASVNNSNGTVIQDITLDTFGHVTAIGSSNLDGRYYTETETGNFFSGSTAITGYNKTNWDTAYGWGNHASAGYLTGNQTVTLSGDVSGSGTTSIAVTITKDPVITLSGAVTGSATMTNLGNVTISTTATSDPTLTLTGDATGSATFTNLGNATLTVAVVDDSHTHDGRYFTETESDARFAPIAPTTITIGGITVEDSADRSGLLEINRKGTTTWAGTQARYSDTAIWSVMGDEASFGAYDDANGDWIWLYGENSAISLYHNGVSKMSTTSTGISVVGTASATTFSGALSGNATTATTLQTARTIGGVNFNGSANIDLPGVNTTGNQNTTGSAATLTTARTIGGVSFNGSANINLPGVNTTGNQNTTGSAATLTTARTIALGGDVTGSASFNGSADITITATVADDSHNHIISNVDGLQTALDAKISNNTNTIWTATGANAMKFQSTDTIDSATGNLASLEVYQDTANADAFMAFHVAGDYAKYFGLHGGINDFVVGGWSHGATYERVFHDGYHPNADTLTTARTIGGVSFDGSANIDLPGVNTAGNQNTSGTAAVSTAVTVSASATASAFKVPFANTIVDTTGNFGLLQDSTATFTYNPSTNTLVVGTVSGALSGNATTASKLQTYRTINGTFFDGSVNITTTRWGTARTLSLGGDLSGSVSINGSANVSLTAQIAANVVGANEINVSGNGTSGQVLTSDGDGSMSWTTPAAGANAGIFWENDQAVTANYTITSGKNAGTFGPIAINSGVTVTVPSGSTWTVV